MAPFFDYKAIDTSGKPKKGIVEADSPKTARAKLKKLGLMVTDVTEKNAARPTKSGGGTSLFASRRVSPADLSMITRQLASLVKSNIPLVEALNALVDQTENERLKIVLSHVRQDVNEGSSLAKACAKHDRVFDTIFINMIEAGESSGTLGLVLIRLADLKEAQLRLRNKIVSSTTYPALMMVVALLALAGIFVFLVPQLVKIFESMNKPMPASTEFLLWVSNNIKDYWFIHIGAAVGGKVFFNRWVKTPGGLEKWDSFKLRIPVIGPLIRTIAVTRFASTMATLLSSGVPILAAMNIAKNLVASVPLANAIQSARENITEGQSIAEPLRKSGEFPPMMIHMISIGEKTGELPNMLDNISSTYEEQVNSKITQMTSLIEPIMIIGMGIVVGFIVVSIFIPLLDMSNLNRKV